jgi:hypothetical protein
VPAEAAEVRNVNAFPIPINLKATSRVVPDGGSLCNGFSTVPTAEAASGSGWGFNQHPFQSGLINPICITVEITPACGMGRQVTSAAYTDPFDKTNALANYLGHGATLSYSFGVGAGADFSVVVMEAAEGAGCDGYALKVTSDGPWADRDKRPLIGGSAAVGSTLSGTDAVWKPNPSPAVQRSWRRCDVVGANCTAIPGATGPDYVVTDADIGRTLRFRNVATDADGTSTSDSSFIEPFIPFEEHPSESLTAGDRVQYGALVPPPGNESRCGVPTSAPLVLNENFQFLFDAFPVRSILNEPVCMVARTVPGCTMTGVAPNIYEPAFAPASGLATNYAANSVPPPNQPGTASAILPAAGPAEVVVNHRSTGDCTQYALTLGADAPFASARPTVDGAPIEGGTLTAGNGAWSGTPAFSYSWLSCDAAGSNCGPIDGAGGATYTPGAADVGRRLRVRVTATQGRSVSSDSEPTATVAAAPAQPGGGDTTAPRAELRLVRTTLQKVVKRGFIPVTVTCDEASTVAVRAVVARRVARRLGGKRIASGTARCQTGRRNTVKVKLTRKARRGLKRLTSIAFTLKGTATDAAGNSGAVTKRARLKRRR